ncbi:hypothetical protein SD80_004140 [Scytonema tolypothrichoides VB-61278]|nr:hypothetical protein SD80_004140 [Scytonema tolypothrichoides VB-61278]
MNTYYLSHLQHSAKPRLQRANPSDHRIEFALTKQLAGVTQWLQLPLICFLDIYKSALHGKIPQTLHEKDFFPSSF